MSDVTKTLKFQIIGDATSAQKAFTDVGKAGESAASTLMGHFKGIGAGIGSLLAGDIKGGLTALKAEAAAIGTTLQSGVKLGAAGMAALGTVAIAAAFKIGSEAVATFKSVAGEVTKLQRITGGTAEDVSRLRVAFKETGIDADKGASLVAKFSKTLEGAGAGTKAEATMVQTLGFSFRDAQGHILPMSELLPKVAERFATMPSGAEKTALAMQLFGKSGADLLPFLNRGADGLAALAKRSDEFGTTLSGKNLQALKDSKQAQKDWDLTMEGLSVTIGANLLPMVTGWAKTLNGLLPILRDATDSSTTLGSALTFMGVGLGALMAFKGVVAIIDLVKASFSGAQSAIAAFSAGIAKAGAGSAGMQALADGVARLGAALPVIGIAAAAAFAVWATFSAKAEESKRRVQDLTQALQDDSGAIGVNTRAYVANALQKDGTLAAGKRVGIDLETLVSAHLGEAAAIEKVSAATKRYMDAKTAASTSGDLHRDAMQITSSMGSMDRQLDEAAGTAKDLATASADASTSIDDMAKSSEDAAAAAKAQSQAMFNAANAALALSGNSIAYERAIAEATKTIQENGATLAINTEEGRANQSALDSIASSALAVIQKQIEMGGSAADLVPRMEAARAAFIDSAVAAGKTSDEAAALADQYHLIPSEVATAIAQQGAQKAQAEAADLYKELKGLPPDVQTAIKAMLDRGDIAAARAEFASLGATVTKTIRIITTSVGGGTTTGGGLVAANGGIFEFFANGGMHEDHKAQIAPAGAWRIWAEPETGGEAYLPLSPAKRSETIPIAKEAVRRLGGVATFANGGVSGGRSSGGGDIHLHVTVPPGADPHSNARAIVAALRAFKRAEGGQAVLV